MILNVSEWKKIIFKIFTFVFSVVLIIVGFKLAVFYMPFLIAFALYLLIEPVIKFFMRKFNFRRKTSSLIILTIVLSAIIGLLVWGIATVISEASNLLSNLNDYVSVIQRFVVEKTSKFDFNKIQMSNELNNIINDSSKNLIAHISDIAKSFFTGLLDKLTSIPTVAFYTIITIMSLYFISTDKIYMIDQLEHHFPKTWVKKIATHVNGIAKSLGGYLKAQAILILISFVISLVGFYIYVLIRI